MANSLSVGRSRRQHTGQIAQAANSTAKGGQNTQRKSPRGTPANYLSPGLASLNRNPCFCWEFANKFHAMGQVCLCLGRKTFGLSRPITNMFQVFRSSSHELPPSICDCIITGTQISGQ